MSRARPPIRASTSELIAKLPTSRDAFYDLALTAPGHVRFARARNSLPSPTAYGSATNENVFLINGVNATDPEAGAFGTLVNVNYDAVEEVRIVGLGSKAEYGSFSGATIDVVTKSGSNAVPRHGRGVLAARIAVQQSARRQGRSSATALPVRRRGRTTRWRNQEGLGDERDARRPDPQGQAVVLRGVRLPAQRQPPAAMVARRTSPGIATSTAKISAAPAKNHRAFGASYHYENNDSTGWKLGLGARVGHDDDLRHRQRKSHALGAVAVVSE